MYSYVAFFDMLLGFVPLVAIALIIIALVWAATKLSPVVDQMVQNGFDALFGVDADYDEKYNNTHYIDRPRIDTYV